MDPNGKGRVALPSKLRLRLSDLARERGEATAADLLRIHPQTLARGAAGLELNRSTAELITRRLAELAQERPVEP